MIAFGLRRRSLGRMRPGARWPSMGLLLIAALSASVLADPARAQPDDDEDEPANPAQPVFAQPGWTDETFDQWVFQNNNNLRSGPRRHLDAMLALEVEGIDRVCKLSDEQKKKLQLAGRGDIKRFFVLYDKAKQRFQLLKNDQQKFQEIWQEINPLQAMLQQGLFDEESFLKRSLHHTLAAEQFARYDTAAQERRAFHYRSQIELAVAILELHMPLRDAQRRDLIALVSKTVKPPRKLAAYGYYVFMYQLSQLPTEKLKPIFDDIQWKVVIQQINQYRGLKQWLKQSGQLPDDDDDADKPDAEPVAGKK